MGRDIETVDQLIVTDVSSLLVHFVGAKGTPSLGASGSATYPFVPESQGTATECKVGVSVCILYMGLCDRSLRTDSIKACVTHSTCVSMGQLSPAPLLMTPSCWDPD